MRLLIIVCSGYPLFKESETIEFRSVDQALQIIKNAMLQLQRLVLSTTEPKEQRCSFGSVV